MQDKVKQEGQNDLKFSSRSFGRHPEEADTGMLPNKLADVKADAADDDPLLPRARVRRPGRGEKAAAT